MSMGEEVRLCWKFVENIPEIKQSAKAAVKDRAQIIEQMKEATVLAICY